MPQLSSRATAAKFLSNVLTHSSSLSKINFSTVEDGSFVQQLCYGVMRWHEQLSAILNQLLKKPLKEKDQDIEALLLIGLFQLIHLQTPAHAALHATVEAAKELKKPWAVSFINGVLRNFDREQQLYLDQIQELETACYSHPQWLLGKIKKFWPEHWQDILAANNIHPPMILRVNQQKISAEKYLALLVENDIPAELSKFSQAAIFLTSPCPVTALPGFNDGLVSVQDTAAQLAAELLELSPGQTILDACAAPGGKTAHILECEPNIKQLIALDIDELRLTKIKDTLERLKINEKVELICADASAANVWWNSELFDRILLDAPCSATGVIRRHPDIKYLRQPEDITALAEKQTALLNNLWPLLKPGGILLYATCSVLPQENNKIIREFLANHADAEEIKIQADWGIELDHGRQILSGQENMDGFYYAKIRKLG